MGYLLRAANNMAIDTGVRRQRDSNHVEYNETHSSLQFGSEASLVAKLDADRVLQILESVQLPPRQRLVFDREILGVPKEQTLAETGMSGEAYEQNLSRARKSANEHLRKAGLR